MERGLKPTSEQIKDSLISWDSRISIIKEFIKNNDLYSLGHPDTTIGETIGQLNVISQILQKEIKSFAINNHSLQTRNQILTYLQTIDQILINFTTNYYSYYTSLIQQVEILYEIVNSGSFAQKNKINYEKKVLQLTIQDDELKNKIKDADILIKNLEELQIQLNEEYKGVKIVKDRLIFEEFRMNAMDDNFLKSKELFYKLQEELEKFSFHVQENIDKNLKYQTDIKEIHDDYKDVSSRFKDLIPEVVGKTMGSIYDLKAKGKSKSGSFWLKCLGILIFLLVVTSISVTIWASNDFNSLTINSIFIIFTKFTILSPVIYAVTFCSFQFLKERKLEEEYSFKSTIALTLDLFKRIVTSETDVVSKEILKNSIKELYTSPRELYHKFPNKDDDHNSFEKMTNQVTDILREILPKEIENVVKKVENKPEDKK